MERGLFVSIASWPEADEPAGRLGAASDLEALREPTRPLDIVPRHVVQQTAPEPSRVRWRLRVRIAIASAAVHIGFAAVFIALLIWRPAPPIHEVENDVEVEVVPPVKEAAKKPEPTKPSLDALLQAPSAAASSAPAPEPTPPLPPAPAPDPNPPAPPTVQPPSIAEPSPPGTPAAEPTPPLLAPPPEPTRAKTQTQADKPANLEPEGAEAPKATHESRPLEAPKVLATADASAGFAVPKPDGPKPEKPDPAPEAPKAPTETEKLAAALPMDTTALPATFRTVLSGNGAAVDAAYKGLVYGRFSHQAEIGERARQQNLKGQVIVVFTIGDDGALKTLAVLQSSGNPKVDALGLEMIRSAAPFPPPPPGAARSFTPALAFGQ